MFWSITWKAYLWRGALCGLILLALGEAWLHYRDTQYVHFITSEVINQAQAVDTRAQILAIRDYLRSHVAYQGAPYDDRPFLRATAADTLRSGKGYCGEVTRTFIVMADTVGFRAQRINLWGKSLHVVAEAEIAPGQRVIVDCQNPPQITDLEPLDQVILRPEYDDYYTLNLRRLRLSWLVTRITLEMGHLTYWTENPHALKSLGYLLLAFFLITLKSLRRLLRFGLKKRGWTHNPNLGAAKTAKQHVIAK